MQRHILHRNSPPPLYCLPPPPFSLILHSGAELMHSASTHTPCNAIVKFCLDAFRSHFTPSAPKQDRKIGVAHLVISHYLPRRTRICTPTALHLILIPPTGQYMVEKIRLFSYFPNPVHLLKSENPARFSRPILAL